MTNPTPAERDPAQFNSAIRQLYAGGSNNTGTVTLRQNQTTTVVNHQSCNPNSHISIMPLTENALIAFMPTPKILFFTRDLSLAAGIVAYTGFGFKPSFIKFQTGISGGGIWASQGQIDVRASGSCLEFNGGTAPIIYFQGGLVLIQRDNPSGSNFQSVGPGGISFDPDGFSLNWGKSGTPTAIASIMAECWPETGVRVSSRTTGSFTLTHSSINAAGQTITYSVTGGA